MGKYRTPVNVGETLGYIDNLEQHIQNFKSQVKLTYGHSNVYNVSNGAIAYHRIR